jgi:molybdopterin-guanine dinucleotide biosynthesis protein A
MSFPAVVTAGDRRASKAVHGESKVYLEVSGRPLVAHIVRVLQAVPEISEVWVVGDAARLQAVFSRPELRRELSKPLHIVPQFRNLYENGWETFRRLLPGAPLEGRDPLPEDRERRVLYVSGDLPFATPQEISEFVRRSLEAGCDYALGLVTEESLEAFYPSARGEPGIRMAYFNLREGRFRQSNLHLIKPAAIANRYYVEEMYEHRYQREFGSIASLAWRLLWTERGGFTVLWYFALMHLAGLADRRGWRGLSDWVRNLIPIRRIERGCSSMIGGSFQFIPTGVGGCAVDIDNDDDYDATLARYTEWSKAQRERAERLHGPVALPAPPAAPVEIDVRGVGNG